VRHELETDYLVVGAGAVGWAFADEIIRQSKDLRVILVDRRAKPGGHWNDAYRFVRLHQPAAYYGVNSEVLESGVEDLASGPRILAYYERVMEKLCATGRVSFYPQVEYEGEGRFRSLVTDELTYQVTVRRKTVDACYSKITVPSSNPPSYDIAEGVSLVPINGLSRLVRPWSRYVVIGAGKTGIDAVLYLLGRSVDPERITWIVPNATWLVNRDLIFPEPAGRVISSLMRVLAEVESGDEMLLRVEELGWFFRLDESLWPTRHRCATVTRGELDQLRRVQHIVRLGRVSRIEASEIVLAEGRLPTGRDTLHIDCTADGLVKRPARAVFDGDRITLQPLVQCQQIFSAALTALIELKHSDDATKNAVSAPVPHPEVPEDMISGLLLGFSNQRRWIRPYFWWLMRSRLSIVRHISFFGTIRVLIAFVRWEKRIFQNFERFREEGEKAALETAPPAQPS
jgi:hypothetical protein